MMMMHIHSLRWLEEQREKVNLFLKGNANVENKSNDGYQLVKR